MTRKEAKKIFIHHSKDTLNSWGFVEVKTGTTEAIYKKKLESGFEKFGISSLNYWPAVRYQMGMTKRIDVIEDILSNVNTEFNLDLQINANDFTIANNSDELNFDITSTIEEETELIAQTHKILEYIETKVLHLFNKFEDLRKIDKIINGEGENFWEWDKGRARPFRLGSFFFERRLIIAWLCNRSNFDEIVEKSITFIEESSRKNGNPNYIYDRNDQGLSIPATVKYLKNNVSAIY